MTDGIKKEKRIKVFKVSGIGPVLKVDPFSLYK